MRENRLKNRELGPVEAEFAALTAVRMAFARDGVQPTGSKKSERLIHPVRPLR
ncbi:MAG: hypothetical protein RLZZ436_1120 [Planctomycetota bacterium]|jgi:hypothetical protein